MAFNTIDRKCNVEKYKELGCLSDEGMFSSHLDLESMEPKGWDFNSDDWEICFEGKLQSPLKDLNEEIRNMKACLKDQRTKLKN